MNHRASLSKEEKLYRIRHSLAHILAQAVLELRPGSKLGFGPPIEDGLYYDFILSSPLSESDFPELEKKMRQIIASDVAFEREDLSLEQALARIEQMGEPYKREYAKEIADREKLSSLSFYRSGSFLDMCEGPHVHRSSEVPANAFKIRSIAGAYWRGDSRNIMMTRIYVWAFENKVELNSRVEAYQQALERDHKKLGKELDIFVIDDEIGKGLPLWLPNGTVIRDELEKLIRELEFQYEYQRIATPQIAKSALYRKTGHLPYYEESMYPAMELKENASEPGEAGSVIESYHLRPMNCPHHHKVFAARKRSYRDLPLRFAEYGHVFRYEESGALSGLLRVRGMCQNDAHIYCSEDQVISELKAVLSMYREAYQVLGISGYRFRLSRHEMNEVGGKDKYVNAPDLWLWAEEILKQVLKEEGLPFFEAKGEAAFYGPKIDVQLKSVTGREETASTIQLDISSARRLSLSYIGADNKEHHPFIIHRAPLGTHERTVAFLLEHFGGAFPTWLAPLQVKVVPVSDSFNEYAASVVKALRRSFIRAEADLSSETLQKKIRNASVLKIPNVVIIGERERSQNKVMLRKHGKKEQEEMGLDSLVSMLSDEIKKRQ
jgi:threonyl-tRNA synthetase